MKPAVTAIAAALLWLALPGAASAGEAGLDPSFGSGGLVLSDFGKVEAQAGELALAPDGTLVAGGVQCDLPAEGDRKCDLALVRYTAAGAEVQRTPTGFPTVDDFRLSAMAIDSTGKVVLAGAKGGPRTIFTGDSVRKFALVRFGGPSCLDEGATLVGTPGDDRLLGTPGRDVVLAGAGDDTIASRGGDDLICSGAGDDKAVAGDDDDRVYGQAGADRLIGQAGADALLGGAGRDLSFGGSGFDRISP